MRGEHFFKDSYFLSYVGSSPHTRGTRDSTIFIPIAFRIIPAYAGNTLSSPPLYFRFGDHPRIRGEHQSNLCDHSPNLGSSPHTRGTRDRGTFLSLSFGIIPAYAGNTFRYKPGCIRGGDHPRIRGEHFCPVSFRPQMMGSSPHTRGTRHASVAANGRGGIIPAYAGNT